MAIKLGLSFFQNSPSLWGSQVQGKMKEKWGKKPPNFSLPDELLAGKGRE